MKIDILSLKGVEFRGDAAGLNVKTASGEITILDHHRPLITILKSGIASVVKYDGGRIPLKINSGFLEMGANNELSVLVN